MKLITSIAVALLVTTGCVVGEELPTDEDLPPRGSEAALTNNARTAFNYFVSKGLTPTQSAGVVGNLMQESMVRPTSVQYGGGPGRGIAQWSVGGRWNAGANSLVAFANARGADRWALRTQLDFIWHELTVVGGYGYSDLEAATTLTAAVRAFQNKYEICGACEEGSRIRYAQEALAAYGGGSSPTPPSGGATCYSGTLEREMPENACVESKFDGAWYQCSSGSWVDRASDPDPCNGEYPL
ncbi:MAG TPA: phage tail tip lysozyme [Kofleriaceae bacterium]|nr:phage tail tip lysozyme [Kofleriaceae bacterium]